MFFIVSVSAHGTFLGQIRLEAHKPQQVPIDSTISFGASTRTYTIREKPQTQGSAGTGDIKTGDDEELKGLLGLPEEETELEVTTIDEQRTCSYSGHNDILWYSLRVW